MLPPTLLLHQPQQPFLRHPLRLLLPQIPPAAFPPSIAAASPIPASAISKLLACVEASHLVSTVYEQLGGLGDVLNAGLSYHALPATL